MYHLEILARAARKNRAHQWLKVAALVGAFGFMPLAPVGAQPEIRPVEAPAAPAPFKITMKGPRVIVMITDRTVVPAVVTVTVAAESDKKLNLPPTQITSTEPVTVSSTGDTTIITATTPTATTTTITVSSATAQTVFTTPVSPGLRVSIPPTPGAVVTPGTAMTPEGTRTTYLVALGLAQHDVKAKDYETGEKNAQTALALAQTPSEKAKALNLLGGIYQLRGTYEQARQQWSALIALQNLDGEEDNRWSAFAGLAQSFAAEGKIEQAVAQYDAAQTSLEDGLDAEEKRAIQFLMPLLKGMTYFQAKQFALAQAQFQRVLESNGGRPELSAIALIGIAEGEVLQKNYAQALISFRRMLDFAGASEKSKTYAREQIAALTSELPLEAKIQKVTGNLKLNDTTLQRVTDGITVILSGDD